MLDANQDDLAAVHPEGPVVLHDDALPVEAWDIRGYVVADFERAGTRRLCSRHDLENISTSAICDLRFA
jgi:hypothetical protein